MAVFVPSDVSFLENGGAEIFTDTLININTWQEKKSMGFPGKSYVHGKNHVTASEQLMLLMSCIIFLASWKLKTSDLLYMETSYPLILLEGLKCFSLPPEVGIL